MIGLFGFELIILFLYCETGLISTNEIYEMLIKEKDKKKILILLIKIRN